MKTLTVATLNLRGGQARWGERAPLLMEQLVELKPDIIGFQEVDVLLDQGNWLCQRFNNRSWGRSRDVREYSIHHVSNPRERVSMEALAIMTHLPLLEHEGFDYLIRNRVAHRLRLDLGGGQRLDFYNTHLHHEQDPAGNEIRQEQVRKLLPWIARRSRGVPQVLVGDFNAFPMTKVIKRVKERFSSAYELVHGDEPPDTIWTPLRTAEVGWRPSIGMVVDYIFVSVGLRVRDARTTFDRSHSEDPTLSASDHYGLAATLAIG
ncbi:MAG: endonuclease/exonuclease/phosphatase family protein [Dehalococcoidia bacterium]